MKLHKLWFISFGVAGLLQCGMATYHFVLPYHMDWAHGHGLEQLPDSMVWAIMGSLVLYAAVIGPTRAAFIRRTLFAVGLFWAIHGSYVLLYPMPLPDRFLWLQIVLAAFPATVALLHWVPLVGNRELDLAERV